MSLVLVSTIENVGLITLNRPDSANALSSALVDQLIHALKTFENNPEVGAIVLTGSGNSFSGGADVTELQGLTIINAYLQKPFKNLNDVIADTRKPLIAAVNGKARGGGCEIAMMCDIIYAASSATFSQPEVSVGLVPGAGGTQRLIRAIGKSKAMEMIIAGEATSAQEAERTGLVAKVFPDDDFIPEVLKIAQRISSYSRPVVAMAKEAVNHAQESSLQAGLAFERLLHFAVCLDDAKQGMAAFMESTGARRSGH
ncbi:enoyl-CoA hydratase [Sanghuangporus baumii]|uniref:Enoyl-CoA hydratase n=1 Tax=Sanghuangporus baumii TaxID=108892 RepID=A0A9Q5N7J0_SANBA|nr:enoyl-CoA hydratase [Sanghuangporus baumii]